MNNNIDKKLLKKRFEKSFSTYAKNALIQEQMSKELTSKLIDFSGKQFDKILEIGCGTGLLTRKVCKNIIFEELFINDLIEKFVNQVSVDSADIHDKIKKLVGDCEEISFPSDLDLIISNATFQWLSNLELMLEKVYFKLKTNGILAFTTFGEQNLHQIKTITGKSLNYYSKQNLEKLLKEKFEIIYSHTEEINLEFNTAQEILKHLKLSGVNAIEKTKWTKQDLKDFSEKYEKFFKNSNEKLILTYQPLYFIAKKL